MDGVGRRDVNAPQNPRYYRGSKSTVKRLGVDWKRPLHRRTQLMEWRTNEYLPRDKPGLQVRMEVLRVGFAAAGSCKSKLAIAPGGISASRGFPFPAQGTRVLADEHLYSL